ncbi:hypothetical protein DOQ73_23115 [Salmonella enterica subsp. enterica]|nr:hypothetical protein [Salmonella enterica subsp. enterica serovar Javiana]
MDNFFSLYAPVRPPERITYYSLELRPDRCPSSDLHYAYEHYEVALSPSLRACDWRNGKAVKLLNKQHAEELASYAEPIMQRRYGAHSEVHVLKVECPKEAVKQAVFELHAMKAKALLEKFETKKAPRSGSSKVLEEPPTADIVPFPIRN